MKKQRLFECVGGNRFKVVGEAGKNPERTMPFEVIHKRMTELVWQALEAGYSVGEVTSAFEMALDMYEPGITS